MKKENRSTRTLRQIQDILTAYYELTLSDDNEHDTNELAQDLLNTVDRIINYDK